MSEAYITFLVNDTYLPGALVLGRSLKAFQTTKKLAVLVAQVSEESIELLKEVFDDIIPVNAILSNSFPELQILGRTDLVATFTKILVWKQTQYTKLVYLDADVLPLKPIDDLFDTEFESEELIAASPDSGWPDIFNSGVFVTNPSESIFDDLLKSIQSGSNPSFDGADQGLLNEYFLKKWKRLPFIYNVTPSASYQYVPAYIRFFKDIKVIHFIGLNKPWLTRDSNIFSSSTVGKGYEILTEIHKSWWNVFNKFYFGEIAGQVFGLSKVNLIQDSSDKGEGWSLDIPKLSNEWDSLKITETTGEESTQDEEVPKIFPWEENRHEATRVFDESTDFHVEKF